MTVTAWMVALALLPPSVLGFPTPWGPVLPLRVLVTAGIQSLQRVDDLSAAQPLDPTQDPPYPLDKVSREVSPHGPMHCPTVALTTYKGEIIALDVPARVYPAFADRIRAFEVLAAQAARDVYGRPPRRILQVGTYACQRLEKTPRLLSEHGLGNAIDISGFDFGPALRNQPLPQGLPRQLRGAFAVRLVRHWQATDPQGIVHARFLRLLTDRLQVRRDIFRVLLGPAFEGHADRFHFDCAPWRLVQL